MSEYGITLKDFLHNYTILQIKMLQKSITRRKKEALRDLVCAFHTQDPNELINILSQQTKGYNKATKLTAEQKKDFRIKTIVKPNK